MELIAAMKIVRALHAGKSPDTEEPLPTDSICLQPEVKAALEVALERLAWSANSSANQKAREQTQPNQGKPWSASEDAQLVHEFDQSLPQHEMAQAHGRSQWAITRRLERLGKIPPTELPLEKAS